MPGAYLICICGDYVQQLVLPHLSTPPSPPSTPSLSLSLLPPPFQSTPLARGDERGGARCRRSLATQGGGGGWGKGGGDDDGLCGDVACLLACLPAWSCLTKTVRSGRSGQMWSAKPADFFSGRGRLSETHTSSPPARAPGRRAIAGGLAMVLWA